MSRKKRQLTEAEKSLWQQVVKDAKPYVAPRKPVVPPKKQEMPEVGQPLPEFQIGTKAQSRKPAHQFAIPIAQELANHPLRMDKKRFQRMKRGHLSPEARLDLHGLTLAEAHPALIGFIMRSVTRDLRLVLVITGKGKKKPSKGPIPERIGALRHQVPHWLNSGPLRPHVLQIHEVKRKL